ncbi:hypothetical protein [Lactiplantibacillus plantarum]|nr:hypothetical protein [Lactiplantibacillus plantarum]
MWFSHHQKRNSLQAPVAGTYTVIPTATSPQQNRAISHTTDQSGD